MRAMKDSGVEWIGEIPASWQIRPLKGVSDRIIVGLATSVTQYYREQGVPILRNLNIKDDRLDDSDLLFLDSDWASKQVGKMIKEGDILTVHTGYIGISCIVPKQYDKALTFTTLVTTPNDNLINRRFLMRYINVSRFYSPVFFNVETGAQNNLNTKAFVDLEVSVPSLTEQRRIADFLDRRCAEIDRVIAATEQTIAEYKALKQSIITEAVTKGVRGERPMKDSGVEWIGEIPAEWEVRRIKTLFDLRDERNYLPLEEVNLISLYTDLGVVQHAELEKTTGNKASNADGYKKVYEDDIIVNIILCWMGAVGRSSYSGVTSPAYDIYIPKKEVDSRFYHHYFRTSGFSGDCYKRGKGIMAMRWRTYSEQFRDIKVVYPSIEEQQEILKYLDVKCSEIDHLTASKQQFLAELENYKKSVIYEYVTGKKELCEY